jgi:hypothetical protein
MVGKKLEAINGRIWQKVAEKEAGKHFYNNLDEKPYNYV